jgi:hypothetical protein
MYVSPNDNNDNNLIRILRHLKNIQLKVVVSAAAVNSLNNRCMVMTE